MKTAVCKRLKIQSWKDLYQESSGLSPLGNVLAHDEGTSDLIPENAGAGSGTGGTGDGSGVGSGSGGSGSGSGIGLGKTSGPPAVDTSSSDMNSLKECRVGNGVCVVGSHRTVHA
jgi:hypothetical protein